MFEITLLEIFPSNAEYYLNDERISNVVLGDVRMIGKFILPHDHYDCVIWWHGPEHIDKADVKPTVDKLEAMSDLVILASPYGYYEQAEVYGNKHEEHKAALYPEDFEAWNYSVKTIGEKDAVGSHLLAWKEIE